MEPLSQSGGRTGSFAKCLVLAVAVVSVAGVHPAAAVALGPGDSAGVPGVARADTASRAPATPPESGFWSTLRNSQVVVAILAGVIGAILGGTVTLIVSFWRGVGWAVFTTLESGDGRARVMRIVFPELESPVTGQERLSKIIMAYFRGSGQEDVRDLVFRSVEGSNPAKERLSKICLDYFRDSGEERFRAFVLEMLERSPGRERMAELVAKLVTTSEVSKQIVDSGVREWKRKAPMSAQDDAQHDLRNSTLAQLGEDPLANLERIAQLFTETLQRAKGAPAGRPAQPPSTVQDEKPREEG